MYRAGNSTYSNCKPKRRVARGDRSPIDHVADNSMVNGGMEYDRRREGQRWLVAWGVNSGLMCAHSHYSFISTRRHPAHQVSEPILQS